MNEAKHTSGPWYTRHGQISSLTSAHGCTIANCNTTANGISDTEVAANAALIAAAPDLLQACKLQAEAARLMFNALGKFASAEEKDIALKAAFDCNKQVQAAIQKAEGR